ncbi:hypothetical protein [Sulfuracidifex tepidarius]|nr:hypothetical protein [Sulfuracidifex tepidarius]
MTFLPNVGYVPLQGSLTLQVAQQSYVTVNYVPRNFTLTVEEEGLIPDVKWGIIANSKTAMASSGTNITLTLPYGDVLVIPEP